ncbi:reverse transcriptase-like protein [Micrococcus sp.]|uniref:reverse transcriptase-like protein n=1 Tax=Micrococcus sp. TaxID=1271 RepID=UPI002A91F596|nr:reverse transcriptase-like protein [Micrococcus sp.]MDY6054328.1 reverse transcriptase-like protein [Micrococcus sp.]
MGGRVLQVEADGGSRGNPGVAGYGALVRDPATGDILLTDAAPLGRASNNVAEYSGLIAGLRMARDLDPEARVHVLMDSKLVVEQMSGRWKIKHEDMRRLAAQAREVLPADRVTYEWIPRNRNKDADRLSNEAMDAGARGGQWDAGASEVPVTASVEQAVASSSSASASGTTSTPQAQAQKAQVEEAPRTQTQERAPQPTGRLHHVELWVADLDAARAGLGWLFEQVGYVPGDAWADGQTYQGAGEYLVLESGRDVAEGSHERTRPGLNHLAFRLPSRAEVDRIAREAVSHGFTLMFADRHPFAGGRDHYAAYLEDAAGFEVELVAAPA